MRISNTGLAWLYVMLLSIAVVLLLWNSEFSVEREDVLPLAFFVLITIVADSLPTPVPGGGAMVTVGGVIVYAMVLLYGPGVAAVASIFRFLRRGELSSRMTVRAWLFNRVGSMLACLLAGHTYCALGGTVGQPGAADILPMLAGGAAFAAGNISSVGTYMGITTGKSVRHILLHQLRWILPTYLCMLPLAHPVAALFRSAGYLGVSFFFLPLFVGRYSYNLYVAMRGLYLGTIRALASALEAKDPLTSGHAERVAEWAVAIGREMKLGQEKLDLLQYVGILHDIGKIGIPDSVLNKPGRYTPEEMNCMRQHSVMGAEIVAGIRKLRQGAEWIRHHHERFDGKGYPDGLTGTDIPLESRIIAVADAFDAMLSKRPYKNPLSLEAARAELIRCSGTQFDPHVVSAFLNVIARREADEFLPTVVATQAGVSGRA